MHFFSKTLQSATVIYVCRSRSAPTSAEAFTDLLKGHVIIKVGTNTCCAALKWSRIFRHARDYTAGTAKSWTRLWLIDNDWYLSVYARRPKIRSPISNQSRRINRINEQCALKKRNTNDDSSTEFCELRRETAANVTVHALSRRLFSTGEPVMKCGTNPKVSAVDRIACNELQKWTQQRIESKG